MSRKLAPPLRVAWQVRDGRQFLGSAGSLALVDVMKESGAVVVRGVDMNGECLWEWDKQVDGMLELGGQLLATTPGPTAPGLWALNGSTGERRLLGGCNFSVRAAGTNGQSFIGVEVRRARPFQTVALARVSLDQGPVVSWELESGVERSLGGHFDLEPVCAAGVVYVGCGDNFLALDEVTGRQAWSVSLKSPGLYGWEPMLNGRTVLVSSEGATIALDRRTGARLWKFGGTGGRAVADGRVFVWTTSRRYCILDLDTGRVILDVSFPSGEHSRSVPLATALAVSDTHAYVADVEGRIWAVDREDGTFVWSYRPPGTIGAVRSRITITAGGCLYLPSTSMNWRDRSVLFCFAGEDVGSMS